MADRYWVGGSGTWNTTSVTNWSSVSGGASGASVPTASDNVFFDQASTYTITLTGALRCRNITVSAGTVQFTTGSSPTLAISGSMSLKAGTLWSTNTAITFNSSATGQTITTNGTSFSSSNISFDGLGGSWELGSAFTCNQLALYKGTFDTKNYNVSCSSLWSNPTTDTFRTIKLGSSTVTTGAMTFYTPNLTFDAGTSTIQWTGSGSVSWSLGSGLTLYNVSSTTSNSSTLYIYGKNTFNNFSITAPSTGGQHNIVFFGDQTINGTLNTSSSLANGRVFLRSDTLGITRTLTINSLSANNTDFRDIAVAGNAVGSSPLGAGDCKGNSGINFPAAKTVYWNFAAGGPWEATDAWAATSGGTPSLDNYPLPQDTAVFESTGLNSGATVTLGSSNTVINVGTIDMSARTSNTMTLSTNTNSITVHGSWINGTGTTISGTGTIIFAGRSTQNITSAGKTFTQLFTIQTPGGAVVLQDAFTLSQASTSVLLLTSGTFNANGFNVSLSNAGSGVNISGTEIRTINIGSGTWTLAGSAVTIWNATLFNNLTVSGSGTISCTGASDKTFIGGNILTYPTINQGGAGRLIISGNNKFTNITNTVVGTVRFTSGSVTTFDNFSLNGTSTANRLVVEASTTSVAYLRMSSGWNVGANSISANSVGLTLSGSSPDFLSFTYISATTGVRYWVGGAGTWSATNTTNWSTTSGGTGGAPVPTYADAVFFNSNSGTGAILTSGNLFTYSIDFTGFVGSISLLSGQPWFLTSLILAPTMSVVNASNYFFGAGPTSTIKTNGVSVGYLGTQNSGTSLTMLDAMTVDRLVISSSTTFDTSGYTLTAGALIDIQNGSLGTYFRSSTVYLNSTAWSPAGVFDAGTSTIYLPSSSATTWAGNSRTYYNVVTRNTITITGNNTFNDFTIQGGGANTYRRITFSGRQIINGNLTTTATSGSSRVLIASSTNGLTQNLALKSTSSVNISDIDFWNIHISGLSSSISGTRIGDCGGNIGITPSAPKTVYRNYIGNTAWLSDTWSATSGGAASPNNFPLPQDTVIIDNNSASSLTTLSTIPLPTINMSARTFAFTFTAGSGTIVYGDFILGSGVTISGGGTLTFSGQKVQSITSAGRPMPVTFTVDSYGGTVQLNDALNLNTYQLVVTNGTFDTKGYAVTALALSSSSTNIRQIKLNSSTVTLSASSNHVAFSEVTNLTFDAGTSNVNVNFAASGISTFYWGSLNWYNVTVTNSATSYVYTFANNTTFNNLTLNAPSTEGTFYTFAFSSNVTVTGTLTCAGATAVRRVFLRSDVLGSSRTLTVNSLNANDCDFRNINIAGNAVGSSPTRAGDCGGNTGINFPVAKTVYWNLAGTQSWTATAWASTSGGTPDVNNFPLPQDTAVFNNTGAAGTVAINALNVCSIDASARTSAMNISLQISIFAYGDWTFGTGVTSTSSSFIINFNINGAIKTIRSNGVSFGSPIVIDCQNGGGMQLADAITLIPTRSINLTSGTFDTANYNVTTPTFSAASTGVWILKMGSGTWTLTGTGTVWGVTSIPTLAIYDAGTAHVVLSDNTTAARTFALGSAYVHKLTIGGATSNSTTTLQGDNYYGELASTKTVAHTIAMGTSAATFGKWSVTGTAGNVVTLTGTSTSNKIAGPATSGINYLAMGSIGFQNISSAGEFYAGPNSTGTAAAPVYRTAPPVARTLYWVGGTGNWSDTAKWATSSGGTGGAALPTSLDDVIFDSASSASAYTSTINVPVRFKTLTISNPASGAITLAGTGEMLAQGNITLPSGMVRTYTGAIVLSGTGSSKTLTTNGVILSSSITVDGVACEWTLGSALNLTTSGITLRSGSISFGTYNVSCAGLTSTVNYPRGADLGSSTLTTPSATSGNLINFGTTNTVAYTFNFVPGTSLISFLGGANLVGNGKTFYNMSWDARWFGTITTIGGANTYNNLTLGGATDTLREYTIGATQTINGTLTIPAGSSTEKRCFVRSDTLGTQRTLVCNAFSAEDADFRDIAITGAAAPVSGVDLGDCKGNSGINFPAPKTVYWNRTVSSNWHEGWATTPGGVVSVSNFPLAQDTAIIPNSGVGAGTTITIQSNYNIGTIDMSGVTTAITLATSTNTPAIHGSWTNGSGVTISGTGALQFVGRGVQNITSAARVFTQPMTVNSPGGTVRLQDSLISSVNSPNAIYLAFGTFDCNGYNLTLTGAVNLNASTTRTFSFGSGSVVSVSYAGNSWSVSTSTNLTIAGTGTINMAWTGSKSFQSAGAIYSGVTLNNSNSGTLTIYGNNTFYNIDNTYKAFGPSYIVINTTTTQYVSTWTARGEMGTVLNLSGNTASIVLTGSGPIDVDYLTISNIRVYDTKNTWYAGSNSINYGSFGWTYTGALTPQTLYNTSFFMLFY